MSRTLPPEGTYTARRNGAIVIEESAEGAILAQIPYALCHPDYNHVGKHMLTLVKKNGEEMGRNFDTLAKIWPEFDKANPFSVEALPFPEDPNAPEFELAECFHDDSYTPAGAQAPIIQFKAQWLNALGGTQNMPTPMADADRKRIMAKFGAKFKAHAASTGGKPAAKPAAQSAAPKAAAAAPAPAGTTKPKSAGPPGRRSGSPGVGGTPRTSSDAEVWKALIDGNAGVSEDELGTRFYAAQDELFPGANGNLDPAQWGQVAEKLGL